MLPARWLWLAALIGARSLLAQSAESTWHAAFVNSEWEQYARVLQTAGIVEAHPWSLRPFGPRELEELSRTTGTHPWAHIAAFDARPASSRFHVAVLPMEAQAIFNSTFPYGFNDGPVWAGRGLTSAVRGGIAARAGVATLTLAPVLFRAENASFPLRANGKAGEFAFGDAFSADYIDQPQRFGGHAYQRLAPGNSSLRFDVGPVATGFSTEDQWWGPAEAHPLVLGNNAGGFPHVFLGTSTPVSLHAIAIHGQLVWGRLEQTPYFSSNLRSRLAMGTAAVITSRYVPGLELGGTRFFHLLWSDDVLQTATLLKPLTALFKSSRVAASGNPLGDEPDNQIASLFARWVFPANGFEVYGEFAREDNSWNLRDFELEPDHSAGYTVGFARTWARDRDTRFVLHGEVIDTRLAPSRRFRAQAPFYYHATARQGHTNLGQVLGSAAAYGGGGSLIALDRYDGSGRWTIAWNRLGRAQYPTDGSTDATSADMMNAFTVENLRIKGRFGALYELTGIADLNRNLGPDKGSVRVAVGAVHAW